MSVPFVDFGASYGRHREELLAAFGRVLDSQAFVQGREVEALEAELREAWSVPHALAVSNGTAALHLALLAVGVGPGDEVILPANTFIATAEAVSACGAKPVFADIEPRGFNISPASVVQRLTPRTRAIIAVHLYGRIANMGELLRIARANRIALVEDACQAHGATLDGRAAGTIGDVGCLSFYPSKNLGTVGEGGLVVTSQRAIANRVARLRDHGQETRHHHAEPGFNYRMPELQAAALRVLLPHLEAANHGRRRTARRYAAELANTALELPVPGAECTNVHHLYVVRSRRRDQLQTWLASRGIGTGIHYPHVIPDQPAYATSAGADVPLARAAAAEILSLPMHPALSDADVAEVARAVHQFDELRLLEDGGSEAAG